MSVPENTDIYIRGINRTNDVASCALTERWRYCVRFKGSEKCYFFSFKDVALVPRQRVKPALSRWGVLRSYFMAFAEAAQKQPGARDRREAKGGRGGDAAVESLAWGSVVRSLGSLEDVPAGAVLDDFVKGEVSALERPEKRGLPVIFPFGCNSSQKRAVEAALTHSMSVIEGPPGTGKTQTILNLLANLILAGQTAAVVSNNNAATRNITAKLARDCELDWLVAELGSRAKRQAFFESPPSIRFDGMRSPKAAAWNERKGEAQVLSAMPSAKALRRLSKTVDEVYEKRLRLQTLRDESHRLSFERTVFLEDAAKRGVNLEANEWTSLLSGKSLSGLDAFERDLLKYQALDEKSGFALGLWRRFVLVMRGVRPLRFEKLSREIETVLDTIVSMRGAAKLRELEREEAALDTWLTENAAAEKAFCEASRMVFFAALQKRFEPMRRRAPNEKSRGWSERTFREGKAFLERFPVVTSSTFALSSSAPEAGFDYLIMDEASQVNLPTAAVCFALAKRAVIVGDSKQLPAILPSVDVSAEAQLKAVGFSAREADALDAGRRNVLDAALLRFGEALPRAILREHYRCHPDIIAYCNRMFYGDALVTMTSRTEGPAPFEWVQSERRFGEAGAGGSPVNERQLLEACEVCRALLAEGVAKEDIGVITPYRAQAEAIRRRLPGIEADTVHAYQGREKDVIIYCAVRSRPTPFLENPNLVNVAVSRAKSRFILISSAFDDYQDSLSASLVRYIRRLDPALRRERISQHRSVFDMLAREDAAAISAKRGESPAEALFRALLEKTLEGDDRFRRWRYLQEYPLRLLPPTLDGFSDSERRYMLNNARLDFLVFDPIDNDPIAAVEVDGAAFHRAGSRQAERDLLKDAILDAIRLPHARFRTDDAAGGEGARLKKLLEDAYAARNDARRNRRREEDARTSAAGIAFQTE